MGTDSIPDEVRKLYDEAFYASSMLIYVDEEPCTPEERLALLREWFSAG